ncbi:superoxide dismutase family protein [Tellurirhabdus bombi]|uniref:superoxide dismutase family protein n=1 Tax=Tellurirhabdus bombi TaxID=2907205 RepID=UPI001F3501F2|nr:superoxide dismutase family protein [Tellurirhabdus bombi]
MAEKSELNGSRETLVNTTRKTGVAKFPFWCGLGIMSLGLITGCTDHQSNPPTTATVTIVNTAGTTIGTARLSEANNGEVTIVVEASGLPVGAHGMHFHQFGVADPKASPPFSTSGEHYNPTSKQHGLHNPNGPHAADLPNLVADAQGNAKMTTKTKLISLSPGPTTLFDADGSSLIIHANGDDQTTDPSGNSGGRIAGGVIER